MIKRVPSAADGAFAFIEERSSDVIVRLDVRGMLTYVSPAVRRYGYHPQDLVGRHHSALVHPDDAESLAWSAAASPGDERDESQKRLHRLRRADGDWAWFEGNPYAVFGADGETVEVICIFRDVTERLALEADARAQGASEDALRESEARYRLIAETTSDIITVADLAGQLLYVSPSIRQMGWRPEELEGRSFADKIHPDDVGEMYSSFNRLLKAEETNRVRWRGVMKTGGWLWMESQPTAMRDPQTGKVTGFLDAVRDVSLQVEQEAALADARAEAEAAAAAKSQFLANMSHEIRTPLTAVLGFTGLLREMELPEAAAGYVRRIAGAGNALLAIVNDILDFSKLEAGKFEIRPRPTSVTEVCEEMVQLFSNQADAKGLSVGFEAEPGLPRAAMIDGDRLRQMLVNLIGNAIKFTDQGGAIVRVATSTEGRIAIEVADTGPGLSQEAQTLLFQRFTQVDGSMTRAHGGTGLGLAISRGIAEAMGGSIGVSSVLGEGATFRVELPAPATELPEELIGEDVTISIDGLRVLVVDDNPANRELSRRMLEAAGAHVTDAPDGSQAVAQLALLPVDVVLMDLRMPVLDGRAALKAVRATSGPNQDVPVLAFTADADLEGEGDLDGFDGLVRKPIQPLDMYSAIARATRWAPTAEEEDARAAS